MKPFKKALAATLGVLSLATAAATFATPAQASYTETTEQNNGVTCYHHQNGTGADSGYPDGLYNYCGLKVDHEGEAWITINGMVRTWAGLSLLSLSQTRIYVFANCIAEKKFNTVGTPTTQQLTDWYNQSQSEAGFTDGAFIFVYEYACKGTYPTTVLNVSVRDTAAHEVGHRLDNLLANPSQNSTYFDHLAAYDKAWMQANDTNYTADMKAYGYWLTKGLTKKWAELFAQQVDTITQGAPGSFVPNTVLQSYWKCTRLFVQGTLQTGSVPTYTYLMQHGGASCPQS